MPSSSSLLTHAHTPAYHSPSHVSSTTRQALLDWFDTVREGRKMPWRKRWVEEGRTREEAGQRAYEVMISEVMLQQTQVATVIAYFERWIEKFPTIYRLAEASNEEVHALWTGLGYYSRATRLLQAAQKVVADFDGILPSDPASLQKDIPGVGPYTAGAIASIAYGVQAPLVDGNVNRVLARLLGVYADPAKKAATSLMWEVAGELVPKERPGDWNEALMELGATICKPTEAKCDECPLSASCRAFAETSRPPPPVPDIEDFCTLCSSFPSGSTPSPTTYPMKAIKKKAREEDTAVCIVEWAFLPNQEDDGKKRESKFLLVKRPEKGLLANLLEFPSLTLPTSTSPPPNPSPLLPSFLASLLSLPETKTSINPPSPRLSDLQPYGSTPHTFSHIQMTYHVSHLLLLSSSSPPEVDRGRWVSREDCEAGVGMGKGSGGKCWGLFAHPEPIKKEGKGKKSKRGEEEDGEGERPKKAVKKTRDKGVEKGQGTLMGFFKKKSDTVPVMVGGVKDEKEEKSAPVPQKKKAGPVPAAGKGGRKFVIMSSDEEDEGEAEEPVAAAIKAETVEPKDEEVVPLQVDVPMVGVAAEVETEVDP